MGLVKMDTDKNNKEKVGKRGFQQVFFMSTPVAASGCHEKPLTTLTTLLGCASTAGTRGVYFNGSMKKGILWSHVCGVSAKEDELHRKSTCELDLLRMSWRFYGASREQLLQNPDAVNKRGNLLSTT